MSLLRLAEECLIARGERTRGKPPMEIARLAFQSTSDYPKILEATAYKTLLDGYEAELRVTRLPLPTGPDSLSEQLWGQCSPCLRRRDRQGALLSAPSRAFPPSAL
jgi:hypothetical protein